MNHERTYQISIETDESSEHLFKEISRTIESVLDTYQKDGVVKVYVVNVSDPSKLEVSAPL